MEPVDGPVRTGVGLLGSPSFLIPRSVQRDGRFDHLTRPDVLRRRLAAKTRHNTVTIALHLFVLWLLSFIWIAAALAAVDLYYLLGTPALTCAVLVALVLTTGVLVLVERASTAFRSLQPQFCSIYQPYFWSHERFWKLTTTSFFDIYNGTPLKGTIWRLLGVRIGRRVFDEGCSIPEKSLVTVGDDCTLNAGSALWGHSLEDGDVQVRPHPHRTRLHARRRGVRSLRCDHGGRRCARRRRVPDEGRGGGSRHPMAGQSSRGDATRDPVERVRLRR